MAKRRRKRRKRGAPGLGDRIEELGGRLLLALWRLVIGGLRWVAAKTGSLLVRASREPQAMAIVVGILVIVGGAVVYERTVGRDADREVWTDSEVEALARVVRSEVGTRSVQQRLHVAWATRNLATERGQTVAQMACSPCGRQGPGRPVSSRQAAKDVDRILAQHVLDQPQEFDPTGGATHFINPKLQDELAKSGRVAGYKGRTYAVVKRRWQNRYGWEPYYRLGPDLEMWGNKRRGRKSSKRNKRRR